MMTLKQLTYLIGLMLLITACEKQLNIADLRNNTLVVNAILYTDEPINNIRLTQFGENGLNNIPVDDAQVYLTVGGTVYNLILDTNRRGIYYYQDQSVKVIPGEHYELFIKWNDLITSSQTNIPPLLSSIYMENPVIESQNVEEVVKVEWEDIFNHFYLLDLKPSEPELEKIPYSEEELFWAAQVQKDLNKPFDDNVFSLFSYHFDYYGRHDVIVSAIAKTHEELFLQNDHGATATNIVNGKGLFVGVSRNSAPIYVTKP